MPGWEYRQLTICSIALVQGKRWRQFIVEVDENADSHIVDDFELDHTPIGQVPSDKARAWSHINWLGGQGWEMVNFTTSSRNMQETPTSPLYWIYESTIILKRPTS